MRLRTALWSWGPLALGAWLALSACGPTEHVDYWFPVIGVQPAVLNFGTVAVGTKVERPLDVTSTAKSGPNSFLTINNISIQGSNDLSVPSGEVLTLDCQGNPRHGNLWSIQVDHCARVMVQFAPSAAGDVTATLRIKSSDGRTPLLLVTINGTGAEIPEPDAGGVDGGAVDAGP